MAVARASAALHHELVAGHVADGVWGFAGVFFAVWWAWMNATWFASAHDADDVPYRLLMLLQMAGVLVVAAGVTEALEHGDWLVVTIGYGVMRVGLAASWLRVARDEPAGRTRALRYAAGISVLQVLWFARLALPRRPASSRGSSSWSWPSWPCPCGPSGRPGAPVFHAGHIEERYGLFTIIVLGESVLSASTGFQAALDEGGLTADLFAVGRRRTGVGVRQLVALLRPPRPSAPPPRPGVPLGVRARGDLRGVGGDGRGAAAGDRGGHRGTATPAPRRWRWPCRSLGSCSASCS